MTDSAWIKGASLVLFAYFLGSVPFGLLIAQIFDGGVNLREAGSGNIGATNVARVVGKAAGALTLLLDAGKGMVALALASAILEGRIDMWLALVGAAAFLGHVFSIYLHFKGGKGVATALGVILFLSPVTAFLLAIVFALVLYFTRYVSLGSLCAALALPVFSAVLATSRHYVTLSLLIAFTVVYTHRQNIARLWEGTESKFGARKGPGVTTSSGDPPGGAPPS